MIALEAINVTKTYGTGANAVKAVDHVSFSVRNGEFVGLVGPSGSGKTTMLAMLAGLLAPTAGQIIIAGEDVSKMKESKRTRFRGRNIGFAFQSNNLVPYLNALENVELMLRLNNRLDKENKVARPRVAGTAGAGRSPAQSPLAALRRATAARRHRPGADPPAQKWYWPTSRRPASTPSAPIRSFRPSPS
jgi:putative ABC transport system ATP-binding protein